MTSGPQGPELFRQWMERMKLNNTGAADYLGLDKSVVTKLGQGTRLAGLKIAFHLQERTGIPASAWLSESDDARELACVGNGRNRKADK